MFVGYVELEGLIWPRPYCNRESCSWSADDARNSMEAIVHAPDTGKEQMSYFCGDIDGYRHTLRKRDVEAFSDNPISIPTSPLSPTTSHTQKVTT